MTPTEAQRTLAFLDAQALHDAVSMAMEVLDTPHELELAETVTEQLAQIAPDTTFDDIDAHIEATLCLARARKRAQ